MKKYTSNDLRKNNFFILYDLNDYFVAYYDNCAELTKKLNRKMKYITQSFNISKNDYCYIVFDDTYYKLFTFNDLDLVNI